MFSMKGNIVVKIIILWMEVGHFKVNFIFFKWNAIFLISLSDSFF